MTTVKVSTSAKLKKAVDEAAGTEEKVVAEKSAPAEKKGRQSTRQGDVAKQRPATKKKLKADRPSTGFWYMQDTEDLEGVTSEPNNPVLGIREIKVFDPSEKQWDNGTLATLTIETVIGQIKGIQVIDSPRDNSIYLRMQSRSWDDAQGNRNYVNDLTLDRKVQAQLLRYASTLLEDVE